MNKETVKQIAMSIFIGACIAFISTLFQGVINWLQHLQISTPAVIGGVTYHLASWRTGQTV